MNADTETLTLGNIDLFNPDNFVDGVPHHFFRLLRHEAPVFRHKEPEGPGFWALTKYDDIVTVSMDSATFSSWQGGTNIPDLPEDGLAFTRMIMLNMDPPQHTKYRRIGQQRLHSENRAGDGTTRANDRERHHRSRGGARRVRLRHDIAAELPLQVIVELMGVPRGGPPPRLRLEQQADRLRRSRVPDVA